MDRAVITIHLPSHRRACLKAQGETQQAAAAYDGNIGRYVEFLQLEGIREGFRVCTDNHDLDPMYTIAEQGRDDKKAAYGWIHRVPDLWEWIT